MAPCPFVLLDVHVHESPLACLPQPGRQRPPRLVCSCRGRGCGWQAALQVRSRDRPCTCKTDLRGRGIVLRGILRWCHSTLGSSVRFDAQWLEEWFALQNVPHVSKAVSPALPLLQAGAVAASVRAGATSRRSEAARGKCIAETR